MLDALLFSLVQRLLYQKKVCRTIFDVFAWKPLFGSCCLEDFAWKSLGSCLEVAVWKFLFGSFYLEVAWKLLLYWDGLFFCCFKAISAIYRHFVHNC